MTYGNGAQPAELSIINHAGDGFPLRLVNDRQYCLTIGLPLFPAPSTGYRVLYVLDGNGYTGTAIEAARWEHERNRRDRRWHRLSRKLRRSSPRRWHVTAR